MTIEKGTGRFIRIAHIGVGGDIISLYDKRYHCTNTCFEYYTNFIKR